MKINRISECRICGNAHLVDILSLGDQALTGVFPKASEEAVPVGPLELVKCHGQGACNLVQLRHSFEADKMYGENYGYRSGLNASMVSHLREKAENLQKIISLVPGDLVLDIGSNDGTSLSFYPTKIDRVGMDPTSAKFRKYYQEGIVAIPDFFTAENFISHLGTRKARIISSIAMFYDLEDPMQFVRDIAAVLAADGIWHLEQSYMPLMMERNAYDTICHEHVEYYALHQIKWMAERCGLRILDVEINDTNGGSFAVTICKSESSLVSNHDRISSMIKSEQDLGLDQLRPYEQFKERVLRHRHELRTLLHQLKGSGAKIFGYGASTKGNVILQFCGITKEDIDAIAEVNPDKFGSFTPGTLIPIISESDAHAQKPAYLLVLPWHFRDNLIQREAAYLKAGGKMIFPLPSIEIVQG